ncbi:MAG: hotdog fold thioesterase [Chloroflexota bacterium]
MIWFVKPELEALNRLHVNTAPEHIGIEFTEVGDDYLVATMPVDHRHVQPYRTLHGGVSAVMAETMGSVGASLCVDSSKYICMGLEINANHIRPAREGDGHVIGRATPIHIGRTTQVWEIRITNQAGKLVCISRLTVAVREIG